MKRWDSLVEGYMEVCARRGLSEESLRLARCLGTTAELWTGLQADYDLRLTRSQKEREIARAVHPLADLAPAAA